MEALKSPLMGLFEKRRAMGFFKYVQNYVPEGRGWIGRSLPPHFLQWCACKAAICFEALA